MTITMIRRLNLPKSLIIMNFKRGFQFVQDYGDTLSKKRREGGKSSRFLVSCHLKNPVGGGEKFVRAMDRV